jgi:hypothetical protein
VGPRRDDPGRGWLIASQFVRSRGEPRIQSSSALFRQGPVQADPLFRERSVQPGALFRQRSVRLGTLLCECLFSDPATSTDAVEPSSQGADQGEHADATCDEGSLTSGLITET